MDGDTILLENAILLAEVEQRLKEGMTVKLRPTGRSMLPFIVEGRDEVILQKPDLTKRFRRDQIVMAKLQEGEYVMHRIIKVDYRGDNVYNLTLMGDGNLYQTEICTSLHVVGVVVGLIRNGRQVNLQSRHQQFKVRLWRSLRPLRKYLLYVVLLAENSRRKKIS